MCGVTMKYVSKEILISSFILQNCCCISRALLRILSARRPDDLPTGGVFLCDTNQDKRSPNMGMVR